MKPFLALLRKHLHDTRGTLFLSAAALFALGWLFVFVTSLNEARILAAIASEADDGRINMMRNMGVEVQSASVVIMMAFWNHPFILLIVCIWAIGRGSSAVGAEVERGTLDLILSRPVSRFSYLLSHVLIAIFGLYFLALSLAAGAWVGGHFNFLRVPLSPWILLRPALNLAALGLPIYGSTLLASALDHVRWRPTMIGSTLTLASFIAWVISIIPVLQKYTWRTYLERITIFKLYTPVDAVTGAETLGSHIAVLAGIAASCIVMAFVSLARRDLPANG
jgi:ABC-2 type transport system permease protein